MRPMLATVLALSALAASASAQSKYSSEELAEIYINLGSLDHNPETVNCTRYASLFTEDAILHEPGVPDTVKRDGILKACAISHGQINPLLSYQETNIQVENWMSEYRTAFKWTINGIRTSDNNPVSTDAISFFLQDTKGNIKEAWSFYDPNVINGRSLPPHPPSKADLDLIDQFVRWGSVGSTPVGLYCSAWASLFNDDGTYHEPGVPDFNGTAALTTRCKQRSELYHLYVPSVQTVLSVSSWNNYKRLAYRYTISGETKESKAVVTPAIGVLIMDDKGKIDDAWDFYDTHAVPSPPSAAAVSVASEQ